MHEWSDEDIENVKGLLESGNGADEVCAVMDCEEKDLDRLCKAAFGRDFAATEKKYGLVGLAKVRMSRFKLGTVDGNPKMLEICSRTLGDYDPISTHGKAKSVPSKPDKKLEL